MTLPNSQATFWQETELPLMSSRADSRAKILAQQESKPECQKEHAADFGPRSCDLLASYHPATSSWRTSQTCLVALATNEGDGLAEYSETWPSAGMMRNGKTYRRQPWALPIAASVSGLWPTPCKVNIEESPEQWMERAKKHAAKGVSLHFKLGVAVRMWPTPTATMHKGSSPAALTRKDGQDRSRDRLDHALQALEGSGALNPTWVEWLMGFPTGHTDLQPSETP